MVSLRNVARYRPRTYAAVLGCSSSCCCCESRRPRYVLKQLGQLESVQANKLYRYWTGFIAGGWTFETPEDLQPLSKELDTARKLLSLGENDLLPLGIGFLTFHPSVTNLANLLSPILKKHKPAAVWLFAPSHPSPHSSLIPEIKALYPEIKIVMQVGSVAAAREAIKDGAHVIVGQGIDAGGHQWAKGAGIISLIPEIADMISTEFPHEEVALLAAGGISDGRGIAAALVLGADGVVMGTRFVVSSEAPMKEEIKNVYVQTSDGGATTIKSTLHDDVRGTGFWPKVYDGRAIVGNSYRDLEEGMSMEESIKSYKKAVAAGDSLSRGIVWAGTGVGLVREIKSASDIIKSAQKEARQLIEQATARL